MTNEELIQYIENTKEPIEVRIINETVWLSQKQMSELFQVEINTINYHIKEIFKIGEISETSVIRKFRITANDGKKYNTNFYNLDAIISVGYRVNSVRGVQFRKWATKILKDRLLEQHIIDSKTHVTINIGKNGTFLLANNSIGSVNNSFNGFLEILDGIKDPFIQKEAQNIRRYISENKPNKALEIINKIKFIN